MGRWAEACLPFLNFKTMNKEKKTEMEQMLEGEQQIISRAPCFIEVQGKTYKVKQISNRVRTKISGLEKEAYVLEQLGKIGFKSVRKAKRADRKLRSIHSKTAAYYLLGNWALFVPLLFWIKWHLLDLKESQTTFRINEAGSQNKDMDFFLANWQLTKVALALSTRLVGEGIKQYAERMESVANMLEKDALGIKEDSK